MRILLLITNLGAGGAQRVFYDHALAFKEYFFVEEAVFNRDQDSRVYDSGLLLHDLQSQGFLSKMGRFGRLFSRSLALRRLVSRGKFDIVISHMDGANWVNVLSCSAPRKILVVHGTVLRDENVSAVQQWFRRRLIFPLLYNSAERTVAVSQGIARELISVGRVRNVCSIPNFFDVQALSDKATRALDFAHATIFKHPAVLVTSGRLVEQKKQSHLLEILASLRARGRTVRLVILGDGQLRESLIARCKALGLRTFHAWGSDSKPTDDCDVYFLGYVPNPYQFLARSTLFLFPSAWEGFPLALCEAMISRVPVLSADCPTGPREILAPGTLRDEYDLRIAEWAPSGVLLPVIESEQDLKIWIDAVETLLQDPLLRDRLRINATQAVRALDRGVVIARWLNLIHRVSHA